MHSPYLAIYNMLVQFAECVCYMRGRQLGTARPIGNHLTGMLQNLCMHVVRADFVLVSGGWNAVTAEDSTHSGGGPAQRVLHGGQYLWSCRQSQGAEKGEEH